MMKKNASKIINNIFILLFSFESLVKSFPFESYESEMHHLKSRCRLVIGLKKEWPEEREKGYSLERIFLKKELKVALIILLSSTII